MRFPPEHVEYQPLEGSILTRLGSGLMIAAGIYGREDAAELAKSSHQIVRSVDADGRAQHQ